jgi:hypothetical protein
MTKIEDIKAMVIQLKSWFGTKDIGYWVDVSVRIAGLNDAEAGLLVNLTE